MKNIFYTLLFLLTFCSLASAQSSFSISEDTLVVSLPVPETLVHAPNIVTNLANGPLTLRWQRYVISLTPGCETQVCDPNQCYVPGVGGQTFTLEADSIANMYIDLLNPSGAPASAIVRLQYTNLAQPADTASVYYFLSVGTSASAEQAASLRILLYPNPATESFALDHAGALHTVRMYDLAGQQVAEFAAAATQRYSLADQPAGTYFVTLADKNGQVFRALQVIKQ